MTCFHCLAAFGTAFAVVGTVTVSSDALAGPPSIEELMARATNSKRIPEERRAPAAEALTRLSAALPDPEAAKRVLEFALATADLGEVDSDYGAWFGYDCSLGRACGECLFELAGHGPVSREKVAWSDRSLSYAGINSQGGAIIRWAPGRVSPASTRCHVSDRAARKLPVEDPVFVALSLAGESPETPQDKERAFAPSGWARAALRKNLGLRTAVPRWDSTAVVQEACVPLQISAQPRILESGTVTLINAFGTQEYGLGVMQKEDKAIPLCRRDGSGDCPSERRMTMYGDAAYLDGEPVRFYQDKDKTFVFPPECRFAPGPKLNPDSAVYIQDVRAILHFSPALNGQFVSILPIGTQCTTLGPPKADWVELQCGKSRGFVLAWQVSVQPPDAEAFRKKAADPKLPTAQQLNYALRALALTPTDEAALKSFADSYYAIRWREYARAQGGEEERTLNCGEIAGAPFPSARDCLAAAFREAPYEWDVLRTEGKRFIRTVRRTQWLEEDSGTFSGDGKTLKVSVATRRWYAEPGVLEQALAPMAERPAPGRVFDARKSAILKPDSFSRIVQLPRRWMPVEEVDNAPRRVDSMCEVPEHVIDWDLNGVASVLFGSAQLAQPFYIARYLDLLDQKMWLCESAGCKEPTAREFSPGSTIAGTKVITVEDFFTGRRHFIAPSDVAKNFPRVNEAYCSTGKYLGPSPYGQ